MCHEDGRWTLTATFETGPRTGGAAFTFDAPGNYVSADDEDARWLIGDAGPATASSPDETAAASTDDLSQARRRRLSAVPLDELPLGEDAIDLVSEPDSSRRVPIGTGGRRPSAPRRPSRPTSTTR